MSIWLHIMVSVVVAALIGGFTNYLAIKMLFHPRRQQYIGRWKVPFTPGLIPKRKLEIAHSLGHVVASYLVTSEGLTAVIQRDEFVHTAQRFVEKRAKEWLYSEASLREVALRYMSLPELQQYKEQLIGLLEKVVAHGVRWLWEEKHQERVVDVLPSWTAERRERLVAQFVAVVIKELHQVLQSEMIDQWLRQALRDMLGQTGSFLGALAGIFVDEARLLANIKRLIEEKLQSANIRLLLHNLLSARVQDLEEKTVFDVVKFIAKSVDERVVAYTDWREDDTEKLLDWLVAESREWFSWEEWLDQLIERPLYQLVNERIRQWVIGQIPIAVSRALSLLTAHVGKALSALDLPKMVEEQVNRFPVERLENVVLSITGRELKAITWLGALIGGLIGLSQAILQRWL